MCDFKNQIAEDNFYHYFRMDGIRVLKMRLVSVLMIFFGLFSQAQPKEQANRTSAGKHELFVCFSDETILDRNDPMAQLAEKFPDMTTILENSNAVLVRGYNIGDEKLDQMETDAIRVSGNANSIKKLRNTFRVKITNADNATLLALARKLELPNIVTCNLVATTEIPPPYDIPPVTANLESLQEYLGPNPGVDMEFAWNMGLTGTGIRVRDLEYGFNKNHEEFNDLNGAFLAPNMNVSTAVSPAFIQHGTSVFGIVYAHKGDYGITGMAHGAQEMVLFPEKQQTGYNRIEAVTQAIAASQQGDVIIYEMQAFGYNSNYVPAEYDPTVWELTKAATDAGIIIVAAAGNGNQNLDSSPYESYRNRGDSGAIIVGAGSSDTFHDKISYSTYGNRVNVQAWATSVYTTGGSTTGDVNQNYVYFTGTSSATPIVASCAIVLQSYYHDLTGNYLTPLQMRNLLMTTGIPQGSGGHIGPIPNMAGAIAALQNLDVDGSVKNKLVAFPNPATTSMSISGDGIFGGEPIRIWNTLGQIILNGRLSEDKIIDLSTFPAGIYYLKIAESPVLKIVRK